jgi:hypothetical protein
MKLSEVEYACEATIWRIKFLWNDKEKIYLKISSYY